ncbi:MAG: pyruvate ferredoxin oxidoreductase [Deltaproteobacteria bacterium]|nr:pyruvate ferredoxin oxidoreductase [Deltaproteobacteria bacterium]MCH7914188.1 pyruvate ferredoxin oxidoreductase [Deltaproteobacteria bacterium]
MAVQAAAQSTVGKSGADDREMLISGCEAIAHACRLADIDVVTAYPIRPYDTLMQMISKMIADGDLDADYIVAESEHSQFEIVKHASAVGARVFVGSSGVGWFYAMEALAVTAGLRLPVVAVVGNRALDDPGAFGCEHNDALAVRDLGWMLTWVDVVQEAFDIALIAFRVAEDPRVFLPCALGLDGAFLTHSQSLVRVPSKEKVDQFLKPYDRGSKLLHPDNPITIAPQVNEDWLIEIRRQSDEAMKRSKGVIEDAYRDFNRIFGRNYSPFLEEYMTDDADVVLVGQGTLALPVKVTVRKLREKGIKVGFVRLKWFRPFPTEEVQDCLKKFKVVGIIDRDYSYGSPYSGGILYNEFRSALYDLPTRPKVYGFICGLGGREVTIDGVTEMINMMLETAKSNKVDREVVWIGVRE